MEREFTDQAYDYADGSSHCEEEDEFPNLEEIHREHYAFVWRTLRHLGVPPAALDDAVQDVFLVVHRRLDDFEGRSSMRTWLFGIARRVAYRQRRSADRRQRKLDALADQDRASTSLETEVARGEAAQILATFLDSLDDAKREVFVLHTLEGVNGPEIASTLGISINTVHSRLRLARQRFDRLCKTLRVREQRAIALTRGPTEPPSGARRRAWALMLPVIELPARPLEASASWSVLAKAKLFATTIAIGTVGIGSLKVALDSDPGAPTTIIGTAEAANIAPPPRPSRASDEPGAPRESVDLAEQRDPPPDARAVARRPEASVIERETRVMTQLRRLINEDDPGPALDLIARAERDFPGGAFTVERAAYRAVALCEAGREREGRGAANLFLRDHSGSGIADRVRASCLP